MNQEYITKMITECHKFFVDRGDYKCKDCNGSGKQGDEGKLFQSLLDCPVCHGVGTHRDISEILLEIIGCLVDAGRAYKNPKVSDYENILNSIDGGLWKKQYVDWIKGTFEDHIATAFIYLFDLAGYLGINTELRNSERKSSNNVFDEIIDLCSFAITIRGIYKHPLIDPTGVIKVKIEWWLSDLISFCHAKKIDIQKHITAKLEYIRGER